MVFLRRTFQGYLLVEIWNGYTQRFFNICALSGLFLWSVHKTDLGYELKISLRDFYKLRSIARKTKVRVRIHKRFGFPFWGKWFRRKIGFILGLFFLCLFLIGAQEYVWGIGIYGNYSVTTEQIMDFLKAEGIHWGIRSGNISMTDLENRLRERYPEITWTCMKMNGKEFRVEIKENDVGFMKESGKKDTLKWKAQENKDNNTENNEEDNWEDGIDGQAYHIVSDREGQIISMVVRTGTPKVSKGDFVHIGDVLVEGYVDIKAEDGSVGRRQPVYADADIVLRSEINYYDTLCKEHITKKYTGRSSKTLRFRLGDFCYLPKKEKKYTYEEEWQEFHDFSLDGAISLPVWCSIMEQREYQLWVEEYDEEEAGNILQNNIREFIESFEGKGVQIIEKDVKIKKSGLFYHADGKVVLNALVGGDSKTGESGP